MSGTNDIAGILSGLGQTGSATQLLSGTCYWDGKWRVSRGGKDIPVVWLESASPRVGPCLIAVDTPPSGHSTSYVLGFTQDHDFRDYDIGLVTVAGSNGRCYVQVRDSTVPEAWSRYMTHYVPAVNDTVMVMWRGGEAYVIGKFPVGHTTQDAYPPTTPPMPELPQVTAGGSSEFPALMFRVWDETAQAWLVPTSRNIRIKPGQRGVWTYGDTIRGLADKLTINSVSFILGNRMQVTLANKDVAVELYRSSGMTLDDGEPKLVDGPYVITIPAGYTGESIPLPAALGTVLKDGGSIAMKTTTEVSFKDSPGSGYMKVEWTNNA